MVGDWRERLKQGTPQQRRQAQGSGAPAEAADARDAAPSASSAPSGAGHNVPDLDALSEGLPPGWRAMWDKTHKRLYYGNLATQASAPGGAEGIPPLAMLRMSQCTAGPAAMEPP